jgi:hypothetical protein
MPNANQELSRGQFAVCGGLGLLMVGLGLSYLIAPELIEDLYGLDIPERGKYGVHYAVGVRDLFYGLLVLTLTRLRLRRSLTIAIGLGIVLPLGDACIVLFHEKAGLLAASPHLAGIIMLGVVFRYVKSR